MSEPYVPSVFQQPGANNAPAQQHQQRQQQAGGGEVGGVYVPSPYVPGQQQQQQQQQHQPPQQQWQVQQQQQPQEEEDGPPPPGEGEPLVLLVTTPPGKRVGDFIEVQVPGEANRTIQTRVPPGGEYQFQMPYLPDEEAIAANSATTTDRTLFETVDEWSNKQKIAAGIAAAVVVVGAGGYAYYRYRQKHPKHGNKTSSSAATQQQGSGVGSDRASESDLRVEFDRLDADNNGYIEKSDLQKGLGMFVPGAALSQICNFVDRNNDGKIDFDEYKTVRAQLGNRRLPGFN